MKDLARFTGLAIAVFAVGMQAQSVISAHSGTIHYVEGKVLLNDDAISPKFGEFPAMENGAILRTTDEGRVEVLLSPGVVLRVGESSSIRMVANSLTNTRVELQTGKVVLECSEILKGNAVALVVGGRVVSFAKNGVYEATADPAAVFVYKGEAMLTAGGQEMTVKHGHEVLLGSTISAAKFDASETDDLYNWSSRRSGYLALANVSAARSMGSGYGYTGGMWAWNPWFGMFTMVPANGMIWSPFGWGFYSPWNVYSAYDPYCCYSNGYYGGGGSGGGSGGSSYGGRPASYTGGGSGGGSVTVGRSGTFSGGSPSGGSSSGGGGGGVHSIGGSGGSSSGHPGH